MDIWEKGYQGFVFRLTAGSLNGLAFMVPVTLRLRRWGIKDGIC